MAGSSFRNISLSDRVALRDFVTLERRLNQEFPLFVSDIDSDVTNALTGKSPFSTRAMYHLYIASSGGRDIARCAAVINPVYQEEKEPGAGFIGYFSAAPGYDKEVREMLTAAEGWLKENKIKRIIAPYNGAPMLGLGVLTAAFDESPMFPFTWQPPHYSEYLVKQGYREAYPMWYFEIDFSSGKYKAAKQKWLQNHAVKIRAVDKKKWTEDLESIRVLFNQSFVDEWEFCKLTYDQFHGFIGQLKPIINPRAMLIAEVNAEPAGFCFGFPDLTPLFRSFKGKMGILQILKLLIYGKKFDRTGLIAIGVLPAFKGVGVAKTLAMTLYNYYEEIGLKSSLYYPVNDENTLSRKFAESIGGNGRILYQVYDKLIG